MRGVDRGEPLRRWWRGRWHLVVLGALTLLAVLLRTWQIGIKPLWIDEAFSVWVARQPLAEGVRWLVRIDQHPPLYYALLRLWLRLGDGPAMVRRLSALASAANVPVLYALGACLTGRRAGLLAAAVLALSPFHVYLAQEARMYALLSLAVTVSLWALAWLLFENGRQRHTACVRAARDLGCVGAAREPPLQGVAREQAGAVDDKAVWMMRNWARPGASKEGMVAERAVEIASPGRPPLPSGLAMTLPGGLRVLDTTLGEASDDLASAKRPIAWAGRRSVWAVYVVATVAALWTHNTAVLYWGAANAIVLGLWARERRESERSSAGRTSTAAMPGPAVDGSGEAHAAGARGAAGSGEAGWNLLDLRRKHDGGAGTSVPGPGVVQEPGARDAHALIAPPLGAWALAQGAVLLLWAPWLPGFVRQSAAVYERFWLPAPTWHTVLRAVGDFLCAFLPRRIGWVPLIWAGYGALLALGLWALSRGRGRVWFLLTAFMAPVGGAWAISAVRPIFYDRTLIWATIPLYVVLAAGLATLRYRSFVGAAMAMVATLGLLSARDYYTGFQKEAWDEAAAYLAGQAAEGDLVLFHATWTQLPFDNYFRAYGLPVEERGVPVDLFARGVLEPQMTDGDLPVLRALVRGKQRVWLVYSHQWYTDPQGLVPRALGEALVLQGRRRFYGLEVRLYVQPER